MFIWLEQIKKDKILGKPIKLISLLFIFLLLAGTVIVLISFFSPFYYKFLIKEDGVIETASALFWLLAALITIKTLLFKKDKTRICKICYWGFLIFYIVCCGEEISWGQRIFRYQGPSSIININKQHEFNFHDIGHISIFSNSFFILFIFCFLMYPYWFAKKAKLKQFVVKNDLPVVNYDILKIALLTLIIWIIIGIRFGTLGFHPFSIWGYYTQMDDEIFECLAAFTYFCFSLSDFFFKRYSP